MPRMTDAVRTDSPLLAAVFDADRITALRHEVTRCAIAAGLHAQRLEDFVLAVNEIVTNAVRHAGGHGRLRMWLVGPLLNCEVVDEGHGIAAQQDEGTILPPSH